jgi:hypothetical protein
MTGVEGVMPHRSPQQKFNASRVGPRLIANDGRVLHYNNVLLRHPALMWLRRLGAGVKFDAVAHYVAPSSLE